MSAVHFEQWLPVWFRRILNALSLAAGALRLPINGQPQVINETNILYSGIYVEDSGPTTQP